MAGRVTQAGADVVATADPVARATQAGGDVIAHAVSTGRVTLAGADFIWDDDRPQQPSIQSISNVTGYGCTVALSSYLHLQSEAHQGTQVQAQLAGGDWSSILADTGTLGAVESGIVISGLPTPFTWYELRARYQDAEGDWSAWSNGYVFQTGDAADVGIPFVWTDWAQLWNTMQSRYADVYLGPGGWQIIGGTPFASCDHPYRDKIASLGRLLGPPSAVVYTAAPNRGADIKGRMSWWSAHQGFTWQRFYDCELGRAGLVACACGTASAPVPQAAYDIWNYYEWTLSDDFQGIFAYIEPQFAWPYNQCEEEDPVYWGDAAANLHVSIYHAGVFQQGWVVELPFRTIFSNYAGPNGCCHYPWYGIRLKVWHDYGADATGKTHRIQVAVTKPDAFNLAPIPSDSDPWLLDITWVGGDDESSGGAGDGGLPCGYSGFGSDRWTGASSTFTKGAQVYRDFLLDVIEEAFCETPCDATFVEPPETPELEPETGPVYFTEPCPPVEPAAFQNIFLGGLEEGALYQYGGYEIEEGRNIVARLRPNAVAPAGYGGECHFKSIVVGVEHVGDVNIGIVPILNGERLDAYAQDELFIGPGDRMQLRRYEVPLYRAYEDGVVEGTADDRFKYGLRGAFFSFEITVVDVCGLGVHLSGVDIDYDVTRESQATGVVYTEELLRNPAYDYRGGIFMGSGSGLLRAEKGVLDDGEAVEARIVSNPVAPAGIGGECAFNRLSLTVTRWNTAAMNLVVTPIIDGVEMGPVTVNYKATTAPVTEITEVQVSQYHTREDGIERLRYRPRGAWCAFKVETASGLQNWFSIEGGDLDYDIVRESLTKDVR